MSRSRIPWIAGLLWIAACTRGPVAVELGKENCAYCAMGIADPRFTAEFVSAKGKVYKFDSIECLAAFVAEERVPGGTPWVGNYEEPGGWIKADEAFFLRSPNLRSPMGLNLAAFPARAAFEAARSRLSAHELRWGDILQLVGSSGFAKPPGHDHTPP